MPIPSQDEFTKFLRFMPLVLIASFAGFIFFQPSERPDPARNLAFGCYEATNAPRIMIDAVGVHADQAGVAATPFAVKRIKPGIALSLERPFPLEAPEGRYRFGAVRQGSDILVPFRTVRDGRVYSVQSESRLERFELWARDDTVIVYTAVDARRCMAAKRGRVS